MPNTILKMANKFLAKQLRKESASIEEVIYGLEIPFEHHFLSTLLLYMFLIIDLSLAF